jgi:hypothetical protein
MNQRIVLLVSALATAFVLVVVGGVSGAALLSNRAANQPLSYQAAPANNQQPVSIQQPSSFQQPVDYPVSSANAAALAQQAAGSQAVMLKAPELVSFEGVPAYEVALNLGMVYVDANNGQILYQPPAAATYNAVGKPNIQQAPADASESGEHDDYEHDDD